MFSFHFICTCFANQFSSLFHVSLFIILYLFIALLLLMSACGAEVRFYVALRTCSPAFDMVCIFLRGLLDHDPCTRIVWERFYIHTETCKDGLNIA